MCILILSINIINFSIWMECNNILLDYYKQKREKTWGINVPSSWVQVRADVLRGRGQECPGGGSGLCGLAGASGWPRTGDAQLGVLSPLCVLQTFHTSLSTPQESCCLWSFLFHFSGAFFGLFCIWAHSGVKPVTLAEGITSPSSLW